MSDAAFETLVDKEIGAIALLLEDQIGDIVDVDYEQDVLMLELVDGSQYVINRQTPSKQIWLSSPFSGAWHYGQDEQGVWRATRGGKALRQLLIEELSERLDRVVILD